MFIYNHQTLNENHNKADTSHLTEKKLESPGNAVATPVKIVGS
jgi:hypothetical protein